MEIKVTFKEGEEKITEEMEGVDRLVKEMR